MPSAKYVLNELKFSLRNLRAAFREIFFSAVGGTPPQASDYYPRTMSFFTRLPPPDDAVAMV